jgi:prepilin-type N-terminal cleavage/methylation domain-containing protein
MDSHNIEKHKNAGMTLIEIVLAIAILGYILSAFAQVFMKNSVSLVQSKSNTVAYNWAADGMEEVRTYYFADISTGTWATETDSLGLDRQFSRVVTVSSLASGLKEVEVEVTWTESGESKEIRIVSYAGQYE